MRKRIINTAQQQTVDSDKKWVTTSPHKKLNKKLDRFLAAKNQICAAWI